MEITLGPIIGAVTRDKAKVWIFWNRGQAKEKVPQCHVFKDKACTKKVSESPFRTVSSSVHKSGAVRGIAGLAELSFPSGAKEVYFTIQSGAQGDTQKGRAYSIRPFPKAKASVETLSFALISCHRPLFDPKKDTKRVSAMWRRLGEEMRKHDCRFLIQAGDQIYADHKGFNAWEMSLQTNSQEKRLENYREIYLKSWNFPEVLKVMETFPQYMIWDDHEITNGWGSNVEHSQDPRCRKVFEAARQAYNEFQHCHNPDPLRKREFYYAFTYGPAAFLCMDLRGHRDIARYNPKKADNTYPLAGKKQWKDIQSWLNSDVVQKSTVLFVVSSVPVCHLSRTFRSFGFLKNDIRDQWSTTQNKRERRILLNALYTWSGKKKRRVFILGGDVHVGTVADITEGEKGETGKTIHQITSSPISNDPAWFLDLFLKSLSSTFTFHLDEEKKRPVHGNITHRYRKRNFAIIKVRFTKKTPRIQLLMFEEGKSEPHPISFPFVG